MNTLEKIWIPQNKIPSEYWFSNSFQKMIWRLFKTHEMEKEFINNLLGIHYENYDLLIRGIIDAEKYFDICWTIVDKINRYKTKETIEDIGKLYGFLQNRKKEVM